MDAVAHSRSVGALVVTLMTFAAATLRAEELSLPQLQAQVGTLVSRWEDSERNLARTRSEQASLEHRIAALKRLEASRPTSAAAELENLLRDSVQADQALRRDLLAETERRQSAVDAIKNGVARIDAEIRRLVPALKTGSEGARVQAARRLNALKGARDDLKLELATLKDAEGSRRAWARYEVAIEPLDGPSELNEKADFVEDTRDKIQEKRQALAALIREAQEEQQLAQAARDFATDVTIFDEESRTGRVQRRGEGGASVKAVPERVTTVADNPTNPVQAGSPPPNEAAETPAAPSPGRGGGEGDNLGAFDGTGGTAPPPAPPPTTAPRTNGSGAVAPTPTSPIGSAAPLSKDLNPSVLLSLRIEELAAKGVDLATLERLVNELQRLDHHLAQQAQQIRARAKQLEVDEAKVLGHPR